MDRPALGEITQVLDDWNRGDEQALIKLTPLVYRQLHRIARRYMVGQEANHLLVTTALVNELYLHLIKLGDVDWQDREHFFAFCARLMRNILCDYARSQSFGKRGGGAEIVPFDESTMLRVDRGPSLLALDDALKRLAEFDPRSSDVVQMRFFGGLDTKAIAKVLGVGERTVKRDWWYAKRWLLRELRSGEACGR